MHMIYLPYSDDVRYPEEVTIDSTFIFPFFANQQFCINVQVHLTSGDAPRATDEQIKKASNLLRRIDLKNFSVCQFANPGKSLPL